MSCCSESAFFQGFWEKLGAKRGFFVVRLWCFVWQSWTPDDTFRPLRFAPTFPDLFWGRAGEADPAGVWVFAAAECWSWFGADADGGYGRESSCGAGGGAGECSPSDTDEQSGGAAILRPGAR